MKGKNKNLSESMVRCLEHLKKHKKLVRYKGGYWARPDVPLSHFNFPAREDYFGSSTIYALIARGYFEAEYTERGYAKSVILKKGKDDGEKT
jgi:hypothetical protein